MPHVWYKKEDKFYCATCYFKMEYNYVFTNDETVRPVGESNEKRRNDAQRETDLHNATPDTSKQPQKRGLASRLLRLYRKARGQKKEK